jgi:hypothetical protein
MERSITKIGKVRRNEIKEMITPFNKSKTSILPILLRKLFFSLLGRLQELQKWLQNYVCV